jgi:hypothetical protein
MPLPEPGHRGQLAELEGDAQADDRPEGAREDAGQAAAIVGDLNLQFWQFPRCGNQDPRKRQGQSTANN